MVLFRSKLPWTHVFLEFLLLVLKWVNWSWLDIIELMCRLHWYWNLYIMIEFLVTSLIMLISIFYVDRSFIWIDYWLSTVYIAIGKRFCNLNWLKCLRNVYCDDWKVLRLPNLTTLYKIDIELYWLIWSTYIGGAQLLYLRSTWLSGIILWIVQL